MVLTIPYAMLHNKIWNKSKCTKVHNWALIPGLPFLLGTPFKDASHAVGLLELMRD